MGGPRKTEGRYHQLNLSLTESELESIRWRAQAVGMRPVHFSRAILLDQGRKATSGLVQTDEPGRLVYGQLARLGNLLNQMVRHLHTKGDPLPADLEPLLKDIRQLMTRVSR